jgi:hypothetical protein
VKGQKTEHLRNRSISGANDSAELRTELVQGMTSRARVLSGIASDAVARAPVHGFEQKLRQDASAAAQKRARWNCR